MMAEPEWTMDDLIDRVRDALPRLVAGGQPRYKVTDVPDARTVRYYISLGLVDQPHGRRGTFALYGKRHLLQVLAVKKLQAEYLPIRKIEALLAGRDDAALEALLGGAVALAEILRAAPAAPAASGAAWVRHEVRPGVEIHVREGTALPRAELDALQEEVARLLRRFES
jgi:DNA-binding transcriptional MerR regulator